MKVCKINDEVLYATDALVRVRSSDIGELIQLADKNIRKRIRLCAHRDAEDDLHEMLIVLGRDNYVRPHRHPGKSESFHVIDGSADVIIFDEVGTPLERIEIGDYASGRCFFLRIDQAFFHSVVVRTERLIFHETTKGPFNRSETEFASWAPEENDIVAGSVFLHKVLRLVERER